MAKKIAIVVLLLFIIGGALLQHIFVSDTTERLSAELEAVADALRKDRFDDAYQLAQIFSEKWQKEKPLYETLFKHEEVDMISSSVNRLVELCDTDFKAEALAETAVTLYYIRHIHEIDSVKWENIF